LCGRLEVGFKEQIATLTKGSILFYNFNKARTIERREKFRNFYLLEVTLRIKTFFHKCVTLGSAENQDGLPRHWLLDLKINFKSLHQFNVKVKLLVSSNPAVPHCWIAIQTIAN
jgi:hypothetical protein